MNIIKEMEAQKISYQRAAGSLLPRQITKGNRPDATSSTIFAAHNFVKRMESNPEFDEITNLPQTLNRLSLLNVAKRTWIERTGKHAISVFSLNSTHTGYPGMVHGGVMSALIDEGCAEYCNRGAPGLYPLTKYLGVEFENPSPTEAVFISKVCTTRSFPLTVRESRKVWVSCEVWVVKGENEKVSVIKASALFILCKELPLMPTGSQEHMIYWEDEFLHSSLGLLRERWGTFAMTIIALTLLIWITCHRIIWADLFHGSPVM